MHLDLLPESDTGRFDDDDFTGNASPIVQVLAAPSVTIDILIGGTIVTTLDETAPGVYEGELPDGALEVGTNVLTALARTDGWSHPSR